MNRSMVRLGGLPASSDYDRLEGILRNVESLGLTPGLESEVFRHLVRGRRTIPELVELAFGADPSSTDYHTYYVRTWRAVRELESRGLVSAPLLGKDKAYRLTKHGLAVLLRLSENRKATRGILSMMDYALFASTMVLGAVAYLIARPGELTTVFVFMLGVSTCRLVLRVKEVW